MVDIGRRVIDVLDEPAAREVLDVLTRPDADRAALIGRLYACDDARRLAEVLMDLEGDDDLRARFEIELLGGTT